MLSRTVGALRGCMRTTIAAAATALVLAATPAAALAHAHLVSASPAVDGHVDAAPRELRLTFSETVELAISRVQLLGPDGQAVALATPAAADSGRTMIAAISTVLAPGTYTVVWQVAGRDGHPVRGKFAFVVGTTGHDAPAASGADQAAGSAAHAGHSPSGGQATVHASPRLVTPSMSVRQVRAAAGRSYLNHHTQMSEVLGGR